MKGYEVSILSARFPFAFVRLNSGGRDGNDLTQGNSRDTFKRFLPRSLRRKPLYLANPASNAVIARMIERHIKPRLLAALDNAPAVALLGPRQAGTTTLAQEIGETRPSVYLDLETASDRARLTDPEGYLSSHEHELVILDEVHRAPELFQSLRGLIDRGLAALDR